MATTAKEENSSFTSRTGNVRLIPVFQESHLWERILVQKQREFEKVMHISAKYLLREQRWNPSNTREILKILGFYCMFFCKRLQEGGNVQELKEQLEALTAHVDYVQENITDCQTSIMEMEVGWTWCTSSYITFISPRIYKSSCIANFSEKERKIKTNNRNK